MGFQNAPQLVIQVLFTMLTLEDGLQLGTVLAFVASGLSVLAAVIIYRAQRDNREEFVASTYFLRFKLAHGMSKDERKRIRFRKGHKGRLGSYLCAAFSVSQKQLQVGFVTLKDDGFTVHVQHSIFKRELDGYRRRLNAFNVSANDYIERVFDSKNAEILRVLVEHFTVGHNADDACSVSFLRRIDEGAHSPRAEQQLASIIALQVQSHSPSSEWPNIEMAEANEAEKASSDPAAMMRRFDAVLGELRELRAELATIRGAGTSANAALPSTQL